MSRIRRRGSIVASLVVTTFASLALAPGASATFSDRNGRIAFPAQTDHGIQIFTVRPNGHDLRQIMGRIRYSVNRPWSSSRKTYGPSPST